MSVNKVILLGNVGQEPTIRSTQDGKKIASFSLATSEKWKDKSTGEPRDKTEWHRIVIFSEGLSNIVERFVKKGTKLFIEGSLQTRKWTDNAGVEKYTTEVVLQGFNNKLEIVDSRKDGNTSSSSSYEEPVDNSSGIEDDIPF
ncbi:MAG: single-strand DNA-binding protein [Candidatus Deianiraeaceae bacterium]|jgi:single-strand DNA-binding protein